MADLLDMFTERLGSVGGHAVLCLADEVPALVMEAAAGFPGDPLIYTDAVVTLLPDLIPALERSGISCRSAHSVDDALACPLALSTAALAIAETGSVITADRVLEQRAPSMLSTSNMILVPASNLVPGLEAAAAWLQEHVARAPYVSFITGPSRSADIERTLTIGVQGPRELTVILVDGVFTEGEQNRD